MRGGRLGDEVTSQTQAIQSTADMSLVFRSFQSANRIDESYYKGMRLRRDAAVRASTGKSAMRGSRLGYEVTSQTQAVQSTAVKIGFTFFEFECSEVLGFKPSTWRAGLARLSWCKSHGKGSKYPKP